MITVKSAFANELNDNQSVISTNNSSICGCDNYDWNLCGCDDRCGCDD